jgi:hypothetical protein
LDARIYNNSGLMNRDLSYLSSDNCLNIDREFYIKEVSGRPDLKFDFPNDRKFILEVKVGNKDHHPGYSGIEKADIALLTINKVKVLPDPAWINITWKEIYDHIRETNNDLIKGFAVFLKGVFFMKDIQRVDSFEIRNLVYLNWMIEAALFEIHNEDTYTIKQLSGLKNFLEDGSGYYFEFKINEKHYFQPWIGINYNVEVESGNPFGLMLWLNEYHGMHREMARRLSSQPDFKNEIFPPSEYHCNIGKDIVTVMPIKWQESFLCLRNKNEQIKYIKDFTLQCLYKLKYFHDAIKVIH